MCEINLQRAFALALPKMSYEPVAGAYSGKTVFITGASGFLGKVMLEKLLYSCSGVEKVYILIREKNNENVDQRIRKILKQPLFSRLWQENPKVLEKIVPMIGDIAEPDLGLKASDEHLLIDTVSFVFHLAATVKFNEPLKMAMELNVIGTERVLNLCRRIKNMQVFVYVSTAYTNTNRRVVDEIVYPPPASLSEVKKMIKSGMNEDEMKQILNYKPNTYTFTKALAEHLVAESHEHLPVIIIRPSIVTPSDAEPLVGWIDNWFGATALSTAIAKGMNRVLLADPDNIIDLIPVDHVSNLTIVASAKFKRTKKVQVYHSSTSGENPLKLNRYVRYLIEDSRKNKFNDLPLPTVIFTKNKLLVALITFFTQILPAFIGDIILLVRGKEKRLINIQSKVILVRKMTEYFTLNNWTFCSPNTISLYESLSPSDQRSFPFDPRSINWSTYIPKYFHGVRTYLCGSSLNLRKKGTFSLT